MYVILWRVTETQQNGFVYAGGKKRALAWIEDEVVKGTVKSEFPIMMFRVEACHANILSMWVPK